MRGLNNIPSPMGEAIGEKSIECGSVGLDGSEVVVQSRGPGFLIFDLRWESVM